jgi:hypothetical protein
MYHTHMNTPIITTHVSTSITLYICTYPQNKHPMDTKQKYDFVDPQILLLQSGDIQLSPRHVTQNSRVFPKHTCKDKNNSSHQTHYDSKHITHILRYFVHHISLHKLPTTRTTMMTCQI